MFECNDAPRLLAKLDETSCVARTLKRHLPKALPTP